MKLGKFAVGALTFGIVGTALISGLNGSAAPTKTPNAKPEARDEMCIAFVGYTVDDEHITKGIVAEGAVDFGGRRRARTANRGGGMMQRMIKRFDKNGDGKLEGNEMEAAKEFIGTSSMGKP